MASGTSTLILTTRSKANAAHAQQVAQLLLEFDLALHAIVILQVFEFGQLGGELLLKCTEFCETGHLTLLYVDRPLSVGGYSQV